MVCLKEMFDWEIICHLKVGTEKIVLLKAKKLIHIFVKFSTKKNLRIYTVSTSHPFERGTTKYCHWAWSVV